MRHHSLYAFCAIPWVKKQHSSFVHKAEIRQQCYPGLLEPLSDSANETSWFSIDPVGRGIELLKWNLTGHRYTCTSCISLARCVVESVQTGGGPEHDHLSDAALMNAPARHRHPVVQPNGRGRPGCIALLRKACLGR